MGLDIEDLRQRVKWAGILDTDALTDEEREFWTRYRRSCPDWVPSRSLRYLWDRVDPLHGRGGEIVLGRPRRPGDEGAGDGWSLSRFLNALDEDRRDVEEVVADHPEQASRLQRWFVAVDGLGRERDREQDRRIGHFYEQLSTLGYSSSAL